MDDKYIKTI